MHRHLLAKLEWTVAEPVGVEILLASTTFVKNSLIGEPPADELLWLSA
ncbi:MAG: hypothetical protein JOZ19_13825 [Rubrobacter sp.]|nr:hypothetical protein [Rubrobacter sp.]